MKAQLFAIAQSSNGTIGLITTPEMVEHTYSDGNTAKVWKGVILEENSFMGRGGDENKKILAKKGGLWTSSNPKVIGYTTPEKIFNSSDADTQNLWAKASLENES